MKLRQKSLFGIRLLDAIFISDQSKLGLAFLLVLLNLLPFGIFHLGKGVTGNPTGRAQKEGYKGRGEWEVFWEVSVSQEE